LLREREGDRRPGPQLVRSGLRGGGRLPPSGRLPGAGRLLSAPLHRRPDPRRGPRRIPRPRRPPRPRRGRPAGVSPSAGRDVGGRERGLRRLQPGRGAAHEPPRRGARGVWGLRPRDAARAPGGRRRHRPRRAADGPRGVPCVRGRRGGARAAPRLTSAPALDRGYWTEEVRVRISARNVLKGKVVEVVAGVTTARIKISVA